LAIIAADLELGGNVVAQLLEYRVHAFDGSGGEAIHESADPRRSRDF
jgi:hypothetical protein